MLKKFRKISFGQIASGIAVLMVLAVFASIKIDVRVSPRDLAFGQASSYLILPFSTGAPVNGKPTLYPTSSAIDSYSGAASAALINSPAYDVIQPKDYARMVAVSFNFTTVPGTSPSVTPVVQETDDGGIHWYKVFAQDGTTFAAVTATGAVAAKDFPLYGDALRINYSSVTGTTGSLWTFTVTAQQAQ